MSPEKLSAVIVTYNPDLEILSKQLNSLIGQVDDIILVDNDSKNKELIKSLTVDKYEVNFVFNNTNVGLGKAQNQGIFKAKLSGATDVILLDQDSVLDDNCVDSLVQERNSLISSGLKIGAVGPLYYNEKTNNVYPISKYFGPFIKRFVPYEKPAEASFLIASGCLINMNDLNEIGYMNEDLFIDYIDIEWCFRSNLKGYRVFAIPSARMKHAIGENSFEVIGREISNHSPLRRYFLCRNSILMMRNRNVPLLYKLREITLNIFRLLMFMAFSDNRRQYLKYSLRGFQDGFKNIGGPCAHEF